MKDEKRVLSLNELREVGERLLSSGHRVWFKLGGMSMYPYLLPGDKAEVASANIDNLQLGQIIVFVQNGKWLAHRLVAKTDDQLIAQGDSIPRPDQPISFDHFKGVVLTRDRSGTLKILNPRSLYSCWMVKFSPFAQRSVRISLKLYRVLARLVGFKLDHENL